MALKDWKLYADNKIVKTWIRRKDNYGTNPHLNGINVSILPAVGEWVNGSWKNKKNWNVEFQNKGYLTSKKSFKTKSQALKFAKQYMRTH